MHGRNESGMRNTSRQTCKNLWPGKRRVPLRSPKQGGTVRGEKQGAKV